MTSNVSEAQAIKTLERIAQKLTGHSPEDLRAKPISDLRHEIEIAAGKPMTFTRNFPFIGRGNVMRDKVVSHAEVERQLSEALRD